MRLRDFNYDLPKNLIAQKPIKPRDHSRLLILDKTSGEIRHRHFFDLVNYLKKGDVLVLNNTKVMPARLIGKKADTGGKVEVFLLKKVKANLWQCLVGGKKRKENLCVEFTGGLKAEIIKNNQDGTWNVQFNKSGVNFMKIVKKIGRVPLPPYIKRATAAGNLADKQTYQTVYADDKKLGSVAAPTAGFHFTKNFINQLKKKGVRFEYVTLQVGLGTFAPVKVDDITKHKMHAEWIEVSKKTLTEITKAKKENRRIIAVGTTSARTLESVFSGNVILERSASGAIESSAKKQKRDSIGRSCLAPSRMTDQAFWTDIFIYPGYKFKAVDAMITNFHLPESTLIILISAFVGREKVLKVYAEAVKQKYRFFSYGDAMLII